MNDFYAWKFYELSEYTDKILELCFCKAIFLKNWEMFIEKLFKLGFEKSIHYAKCGKDMFCFEWKCLLKKYTCIHTIPAGHPSTHTHTHTHTFMSQRITLQEVFVKFELTYSKVIISSVKLTSRLKSSPKSYI